MLAITKDDWATIRQVMSWSRSIEDAYNRFSHLSRLKLTYENFKSKAKRCKANPTFGTPRPWSLYEIDIFFKAYARHGK